MKKVLAFLTILVFSIPMLFAVVEPTSGTGSVKFTGSIDVVYPTITVSHSSGNLNVAAGTLKAQGHTDNGFSITFAGSNMTSSKNYAVSVTEGVWTAPDGGAAVSGGAPSVTLGSAVDGSSVSELTITINKGYKSSIVIPMTLGYKAISNFSQLSSGNYSLAFTVNVTPQ